MEASKISRLRVEQQKAISETEEKMGQLEKYKADYKALQTRLETLPDKVTHEVMVPFGKLAFMPGQLVHTNEILVLLGDNWFVERSAKQAREIAGRRITELDKRIAELKGQKQLLEPRLGLTSELQAVAEGKGDYKEIVEEYDEEKERLWDEQHKINVRRHHEKLKNSKNTSNPDDGKMKVEPLNKDKGCDDELWSRLDALEKQEKERGELNSSFESDSDKEDDRGSEDRDGRMEEGRRESPCPTRDKKVNWVDENGRNDDKDDDDGSDYDNDAEDSDSDDDKSRSIIKTIRFQHTKVPPHEEPEKSSFPSHDGAKGSTVITSPAEIYKLFSPRPILKKFHESSRTTKDDAHHQAISFPDNQGAYCDLPSGRDGTDNSNTMLITPNENSKEKAFTGIVRENPTQSNPTPNSSSSSSSSFSTTTTSTTKRVSKFKAQRMGQNL